MNWKIRLKNEQYELEKKIQKLEKGISSETVPEDEVSLLTEQLHYMKKYNEVINKRKKKHGIL